VRHVHDESEVEFGEKGELTRLFGTVQDITERKQFEDPAAPASRSCTRR
jgi:PAS domain-containing protein